MDAVEQTQGGTVDTVMKKLMMDYKNLDKTTINKYKADIENKMKEVKELEKLLKQEEKPLKDIMSEMVKRAGELKLKNQVIDEDGISATIQLVEGCTYASKNSVETIAKLKELGYVDCLETRVNIEKLKENTMALKDLGLERTSTYSVKINN